MQNIAMKMQINLAYLIATRCPDMNIPYFFLIYLVAPGLSRSRRAP